MALAVRKTIENDTVRPQLRAAVAGDCPAASPVHALQSDLARLVAVPAPARYPGAVRVAVPLLGSGLLWALVLRAVGLI